MCCVPMSKLSAMCPMLLFHWYLCHDLQGSFWLSGHRTHRPGAPCLHLKSCFIRPNEAAFNKMLMKLCLLCYSFDSIKGLLFIPEAELRVQTTQNGQSREVSFDLGRKWLCLASCLKDSATRMASGPLRWLTGHVCPRPWSWQWCYVCLLARIHSCIWLVYADLIPEERSSGLFFLGSLLDPVVTIEILSKIQQYFVFFSISLSETEQVVFLSWNYTSSWSKLRSNLSLEAQALVHWVLTDSARRWVSEMWVPGYCESRRSVARVRLPDWSPRLPLPPVWPWKRSFSVFLFSHLERVANYLLYLKVIVKVTWLMGEKCPHGAWDPGNYQKC